MINAEKYQIDCARDELQKAADCIADAADFLINIHNPEQLNVRWECQMLVETLRNIAMVDMNLDQMKR